MDIDEMDFGDARRPEDRRHAPRQAEPHADHLADAKAQARATYLPLNCAHNSPAALALALVRGGKLMRITGGKPDLLDEWAGLHGIPAMYLRRYCHLFVQHRRGAFDVPAEEGCPMPRRMTLLQAEIVAGIRDFNGRLLPAWGTPEEIAAELAELTLAATIAPARPKGGAA
jgi:hypothetical protein